MSRFKEILAGTVALTKLMSIMRFAVTRHHDTPFEDVDEFIRVAVEEGGKHSHRPAQHMFNLGKEIRNQARFFLDDRR